jgi:hypothetical protein
MCPPLGLRGPWLDLGAETPLPITQCSRFNQNLKLKKKTFKNKNPSLDFISRILGPSTSRFKHQNSTRIDF